MTNLKEAFRALLNNQEQIGGSFDESLEKNVKATSELLQLDYDSLETLIPDITTFKNVRGKFISLSFHLLLSFKDGENILSINEVNDINNCFQFIISLGILPNLIPGVDVEIIKSKNVNKFHPELSIQDQYYTLSASTKGLLICFKYRILRNFILTNHFNHFIAALLQLCYAPIKKPDDKQMIANQKDDDEQTTNQNGFFMTQAFYGEIQNDKTLFETHLKNLLWDTYSTNVLKELMVFYGSKTPGWLKKQVFRILVQRVQHKNGVEYFIRAVINSESNVFSAKKSNSNWKQYDIVVKILMTAKPSEISDEEYYNNICAQVLDLLNKKDATGILHYEHIVGLCIKYLFEHNENNCRKYFITPLLNFTLKYTKSMNYKIENEIITTEMAQNLSLLYDCFIVTSGITNSLPCTFLEPIIKILFNLFIVVHNAHLSEIKQHLSTLLLTYIKGFDENHKKIIFDCLLFDVEVSEIFELKDDIEFVVYENELQVRKTDNNVRFSPFEVSECFLELLQTENSENFIVPLCRYLLEISTTEMPEYLSNQDLLKSENAMRKLVAYNLLSKIISDEKAHNYLKKDPTNILTFIERFLKNIGQNNVHKSQNSDSTEFQTIFLLIMIVSIITDNQKEYSLKSFPSLAETLNIIRDETSNKELKSLINEIRAKENSNEKSLVKSESEFEKAIDEICDPLLPVRGHGLLTLTKLIETKDPETCAKKQFVLAIFQQQLKNDDSYIYLSAIGGLAALADSFPDVILNTIIEEFSSTSKNPSDKELETKMKLGEVLLRVVKSLGDSAPKYKSLLLNTFLSGVKDDDPLLRASSLSNLGELCRVLGFKLGTIVSEVLSCIHNVISTDKAVEARRAAVSVIRQLFIGLQKETIVFLKDDILPIYRTLKTLYTTDPDDITRLQAQLALEELNEIMRDFLFPNLKLETEKKMMLK